MSNKIQTLRAYKCNFRSLQKSNALKNDGDLSILNKDDEIDYSWSDFINKYVSDNNTVKIGTNNDKAILFSNSNFFEYIKDNYKMWHISPKVGKYGKPLTVIKTSINKEYTFANDAVALYDHHVFLFEKKYELFAIFYRESGSGCKTVFLETANKVLASINIKLDMTLICAMPESNQNISVDKLGLKYYQKNKTSDIADDLLNSKCKTICKELILTLTFPGHSTIQNIINRLIKNDIDKDIAFAEIKKESEDFNDYNDADLYLKIGKRHRKVNWNDIENILGDYDITDKIHNKYKKDIDFIEDLKSLANDYYLKIINSGNI